MQMANKHMERCSILSQTIKSKIPNDEDGVEHMEFFYTADRNIKWYNYFGKELRVS